MGSNEISVLAARKVAQLGHFANSHGVAATNIQDLLVEPLEVVVDLDDAQGGRGRMWLVLKAPDASGYWIAYDAEGDSWGVVEVAGDAHVLVAAADDLAGALRAM